VTVHRDKFPIIDPTRCTNSSNLFLEGNSTCFEQFPCISSGVFHCSHSNGICHTSLLTACEQDQDVRSWSCLQAVSKPVWHIPLLFVQWKTPDAGQGNCPKNVEFPTKNKFEELVHLVGSVVRNKELHLIFWPLWYLLFIETADNGEVAITDSEVHLCFDPYCPCPGLASSPPILVCLSTHVSWSQHPLQ